MFIKKNDITHLCLSLSTSYNYNYYITLLLYNFKHFYRAKTLLPETTLDDN